MRDSSSLSMFLMELLENTWIVSPLYPLNFCSTIHMTKKSYRGDHLLISHTMNSICILLNLYFLTLLSVFLYNFS